ncbi:glycoside hydrolase family 15 protein [Azohydromonas caseinilytica]|uniref:Glycoside hydrolase family 15 protein n=1 Tax=Azohydromonas caseinilytica TaxID=2728836 RepID=A0A848FF53_9BURK|nr:glycoside hydrolase family 15 protein [Azohydromonas caseinilytica]NML17912.1 glycoside hydrolase family 15 protein [Azohydromonas caseinilytica]
MRQPPIADYALIGNTFTAALVSRDGSIDWCCLPHFDSPAVFCRLLDARIGGCFRLGPAAPSRCERRYLDGSAVLATRFETADGVAQVTDFMPAPDLLAPDLPPHGHAYFSVLRRVEGLQGRVALDLLFKPTFDFVRQAARLAPQPGGCRADAGDESLHLALVPEVRLQVVDGEVRGRLDIPAGAAAWVVLSHGRAGMAGQGPAAWERSLRDTLRQWGAWGALNRYTGPYAEAVALSARVLKLLTFAPGGSIVAAPTTSLPEAPGGVRNWDYRFCWLRDAALMLGALLSVGHEYAADRFFHWLSRLWEPERRIQIMYRLDGGERLPEAVLEHLAGYRGARPVRIGNGAANQVQLDIYGHLLDAAHVYLEGRRAQVRPALARVLTHLANEAARRWRQPDQGIWEMRSAPAHHVSSKLMCWVALDRALRLAAAGRIEGDTAWWRRERDAVARVLHEQGFNAALGAYTQVLGGQALDASVLMMPIVGFLPAGDARMRATVQRISQELMHRGLVWRYRSDDGLDGDEGTFAICSFWLVENLALQGRVQEACALFEHITSFASDLGLLAEEIEPGSGELLGNYPQGYTHLALIRSALAIGRAQGSASGVACPRAVPAWP